MLRLAPLALVAASACAPAPKPAPRTEPPRHAAEPAPQREAPPEDRRCADVPRLPADNLSVVIDEPDGALGAALARSPADAAAEWAELLRKLSKDCAGSEVEHALPSLRVVLRTRGDCKAGAPGNELSFDFVPRSTGSAVEARGRLLVQGRPVKVDARVLPSSDPKALCAIGSVDLGAAPAPRPSPGPGDPQAAVAQQRWLGVTFQLVAGIIGLFPR